MSQLLRFPRTGVQRRVWHLYDAQGQTVGRFATRIANLLQGKHKPTRQSNLDEGDTVVIVNCEKVHFTGKKWSDKLYRKHSGFPGGLKEVPAEHLLAKHPEQILFKAIYGMLPKNKHRRPRMNRLKLYVGPEHPHQAQFPNQPLITVEKEIASEDEFPDMEEGDAYEYDPEKVERYY